MKRWYQKWTPQGPEGCWKTTTWQGQPKQRQGQGETRERRERQVEGMARNTKGAATETMGTGCVRS